MEEVFKSKNQIAFSDVVAAHQNGMAEHAIKQFLMLLSL